MERDELDAAIDFNGVQLSKAYLEAPGAPSISSSILCRDPTETRRRCRQRQHAREAFELIRRFLNADREEHLAVRLNDEEVAVVEEMKSLLSKIKSET